MKCTATRWLLSVNMLVRRAIYSEKETTTFQSDGSVVSKLIWFEVNLNLSNSYFEKRSPGGQCSTGVVPDIAVRN